MKGILIISYYWPPSGGSGVQRWMYFSKYLKELGYNPIVITVDPKYASYSSIDFSLIKEVENIEVHKTKSFEILKLYSFFKSKNNSKIYPQSYIPNKSIFDKLTSFIRVNFIIPDARVGWNKFAFNKAKQIIMKNNINYLITTGPPHSSHLVGLKIKKKFDIKWIVDFRDPWSEIFYTKNQFKFEISKKINQSLERKVLNSADKIITTVGEKYHEILQNKITNKKNIHGIYNGFDKINFDKIEASETSYYNIVFCGVLSKNHNYKLFNKVIDELSPKENNLNMRFSIAGKIDSDVIKLFSDKIKTEYKGYLEHNESISLMKSSHLLINFNYLQTEETDMVSGKLIEYIASGSPVINFSDSSEESKSILMNSKKSFNANNDDFDKVYNFVNEEYNLWLEGKLKKDLTISLDHFSRENLTKKLVEVINSI